MALEIHKGLFYLHFCMTLPVRDSITFYVEYQQSNICCFRATDLSCLQ